jgi:hypothetical protein
VTESRPVGEAFRDFPAAQLVSQFPGSTQEIPPIARSTMHYKAMRFQSLTVSVILMVILALEADAASVAKIRSLLFSLSLPFAMHITS